MEYTQNEYSVWLVKSLSTPNDAKAAAYAWYDAKAAAYAWWYARKIL
jgi:hypothetical protein